MSCNAPIRAFQLMAKNSEGKNVILFNEKDVRGKNYIETELPCGRCMGCRIEKARSLAIRCMHESEMFEFNCCLTLTYDDDHIDEDHSLRPDDWKTFIHNLRQTDEGFQEVICPDDKIRRPIRYIQTGEYGDIDQRPHHHAMLFNYDFIDKQYLYTSDAGQRYYESQRLEELWPHGIAHISEVNSSAANYICRYCTKKIIEEIEETKYQRINENTGEIYEVLPEYSTKSNRPGLGRFWLDKYGKETFDRGYLYSNGHKAAIPKYYERIMETINPCSVYKVKMDKKKEMMKRPKETTKRKAQKDRALKLKMKNLKERNSL